MKVSVVKTIEELAAGRAWFAWYPVMVEYKGREGQVVVHRAWLQNVKRTLVRIQGVSVFKSELL